MPEPIPAAPVGSVPAAVPAAVPASPAPRRIVLVGYGPVGARLVEELLPVVRAGLATLTVVGAESADAYNRVLIADYAVGRSDRDTLEVTDTDAARAAGVDIRTGEIVTRINRVRRTVTLGDGTDLGYDRLVLATGARANVPTLDGVTRLRRTLMRPPTDAGALDTADAPLPRGVTALRDLDDAATVLETVRSGGRIVVLGAGVLGMEFALAAAQAGSDVCVVYHADIPLNRNLDRGGGTVLARSARRAGVTMVSHARAESILFTVDADGHDRFDALICADGKQIPGDLLVLSCGIGARTELAGLSGLSVSTGILVDESLRSWTDPAVFAIGDCAHVAPRPAPGASTATPAGGPTGLIGPGWRQADWLAARFAAEIEHDARAGAVTSPATAAADVAAPADFGPALAVQAHGVVMLKAEGIDVVAAGDTSADPWDIDPAHPDDGHGAAEPVHGRDCAAAPGATAPRLGVSQWSDPEHGRYVKMVTRGGILTGFICVGMPRTGAELALLFERGSELPADRSLLLRYDGPDVDPAGGGDAFAPDATVCWCNGVTAGAITASAAAGNTDVACIGSATRAGTGCGGCRGRIGEVLERFALTNSTEIVG
ncbi:MULTISPECIES: NAD(P)/FAD-dependent oxidoreductase [unclassified Cryobacterium]|uniref:NAD(P)/FAD-dependent oxidoreductase n=1 Tax=unclassified Cryobacterium TaxID=2649013 RepID=UPI00106C9595|nr:MULTISPECIES: FAD-dependent oxidoreductase [unclassified Cryobacterium]TFC00618.1 NAD(P)/FAD-dependent oxidoreductase [Cryobacterium sp. MDB2-A-1]TFC09390.1 NAD(P)/FAD-dependent oxidoreductase [Cryobacterium sp. MDB2-A-2]TFC23477.1 NAD(P)/FAD-dependent oxidoreductase [Cryobacterium sp. MDB2-10]